LNFDYPSIIVGTTTTTEGGHAFASAGGADEQVEEGAITTISTGTAPATLIRNELLAFGPEAIWNDLIDEAAASSRKFQSSNQNPGIVMEVGMHRAFQCVRAASAGLQAHCVEPSPTSFQRVKDAVLLQPKDIQERIHLYQNAAGATSGELVPFSGSGGTGDFVGAGIDVWKMTTNEGQPSHMPKIMVSTKRLDDIIQASPPKEAFLMKIDVQGFEPQVFQGLAETLRHHKAHYILFEYWPKGIDLLAGTMGECKGAIAILSQLIQAGYTLYAMGVTAHPAAPKGQSRLQKADYISKRPLDDLMENCMWYYQIEDRFPSEKYKMGYWSDIVAVAPTANLKNPTTAIGKVLQQRNV
jgi:FkbM family methyltransferase